MTSTMPAATQRPRTSDAHGRPIVVASVPSGHVYVRHIVPEPGSGSGPAPVRLPDPDPGPSRAASQPWWPPTMLDPAWAAAADFDVFHVQFGFDARTPEQLGELVRVLRERGKPLVQTVHDLRNPHHPTSTLHDEQLDALVPEADAVLTLTPGAAAEIQRRWGREALVLPHPHVVELPRMARMRADRAQRRAADPDAPFVVGVHVKSVRASMDPMAVLPTLVDTVAELPGAVLQVNGHHELLDDDGKHHDAALAAYLRREDAAGHLDLRKHEYFTDTELWDYFASIDVSVLPYRFGTHSGWLEACRDLGTTVVAPTCGYYREQGPVLDFVLDEQRYDEATLAAAVVRAYEERPELGAYVEDRRRQRARIAEAHDRLYRRLIDDSVRER